MIQDARDGGCLLPFSTRARAEGPYARAARIPHSSIATCTQPRDMHNPQFRLLVSQLQWEQATRELKKGQTFLTKSVKNAMLDMMKW